MLLDPSFDLKFQNFVKELFSLNTPQDISLPVIWDLFKAAAQGFIQEKKMKSIKRLKCTLKQHLKNLNVHTISKKQKYN